MNLKNIIAGIEGLKAKGNLDVEVNNISTDSRNIKQGDMFIAIKGFDTDGHKYIQSAIQNGAKVILIDESETKKCNKHNTSRCSFNNFTRLKNCYSIYSLQLL